MADDRIILLKESDIISDSMHKINYNFQLLDQDSKVNDYKWQQYVNSIDKKFDGFKNNFDSRENAIAQNLADIQDLIDSMASKEDIQNQINNAIQNANEELNGFISQVVGQQIGQSLGGYATTSYVQNAIGGLDLDYVRTSAFNSYKSNAEERTADATMMAANSTFAKDGGKLVFADGSVSSFRTIEEYWNSLSNAAKAQINSNYERGLNDPDVLQSFITHCESKFRSVSTELALVKTSVVDGGASFDIMAAVNNEDTGKAITSAIFGWANQQGSGIILTADHVQIEGDFAGVHARDILWDADDRLALRAGQLIFTADNFVLTKNGDIYANNAELNNVRLDGDITAKTFRTNSGKTVIGADGILHAEGAIISGKIKANEFEAIATESINNNGVSGNLTKTTTITGSDFQMSSQGELTTPNGIFNTDGNSLYMRIVDAIPNSGNNDIPETVLYGVPALCMRYKGIEYILSPASWYRPGSGGQDTSNMRFIRRYSGIQLKFNGVTNGSDLSNYCIKLNNFSLGSGLTATVYIFRPENDLHPKINGSRTLTIGSGDSVFQFSILNWGDNDHNTAVNMINSVTPRLINSYSGGDTVDGAYTLGSVLGQDGLRFANANGVQTVINSNNRDAMKDYLPTSDYTIGVEMFKETPDTPYTVLPSEWGLSRIAAFINSLIKTDNGHAYGNTRIWKSNNAFGYNTNEVLFNGQGGDSPSALNGHLPFEDNTKQSNYFYYKVDYWPLSSITNNGYIHSSGTNQIVVRYTAHIRADYDYNTYSDRLQYMGLNPLPEGENNYRDVWFKNIELTAEFYAVIDITSGNISNYNPSNPVTHSYVEEKVKYFLENYPFDTQIYEQHVNQYVDFYKYIKLTGNIYVTDRVTYQDILVSYDDSSYGISMR